MLGKAITDNNGNCSIAFDQALVLEGNAQLIVSGSNILNNVYAFSIVNFGSSINDVNNKTLDVKAYPNPTEGILNLQIQNATTEKVFVEIYNLYGQKLCVSTAYESKYGAVSVDLSEFVRGLYYYKISQGDKNYFGKIEKQ
jgi:hypothetical protein